MASPINFGRMIVMAGAFTMASIACLAGGAEMLGSAQMGISNGAAAAGFGALAGIFGGFSLVQ